MSSQTQVLEFHPEAIIEAREARRWYRLRDQAVADSFVAELDRAVANIQDAPRRWPPYLQETRRFVMQRFPYSVIYREGPEVIRVLAIAHTSKKPGYWRTRR